MTRLARVRDKLRRGETVFLAGLGLAGTHNSGVALVEVTQANGPRLIVNNEEERFSGNKHTTEYPRRSIDEMVATLRAAWARRRRYRRLAHKLGLSSLAGTMARSLVEELPESLKLLRFTDASAFDRRRLEQMMRSPKILARQLRPDRAAAADLHAAPWQSRLVFVCGLAVCR